MRHLEEMNTAAADLNTVQESMKRFLGEISEFAELLFVTDNTEDFYENFGSGWDDFVKSVPA